MFTKDDKWLLASHLQKSIRRGMVDQAIWATGHLYDVDRAYLAYRTGIVLMEDIAGAGRVDWVNTDQPWGARHFQSTKNEDDKRQWEGLIGRMASSMKDNLACEYIHCAWWLNEFQEQQGPWEHIEPKHALQEMHNLSQPWWYRGLMSWRAVGTKKYPHDLLPEVQGEPEVWLEACPNDLRPLIQAIGFKQIEAHSVFLPLVFARTQHTVKQTLQSQTVGPWLDCALDKHTREGSKAIMEMYKNAPYEHKQLFESHRALEILGKLYFWVEGGKHDHVIFDQQDQVVRSDIRKKWLQHHAIHGKKLFDAWVDLPRLNAYRQQVIQSSPHATTQGLVGGNKPLTIK